MNEMARLVGRILLYFGVITALGAGGIVALVQWDNRQMKACAREAAPLEYQVIRQTIDQVFEDHNGYRVKFRDQDEKVITSFFPYSQIPSHPLFPEIEGLKGLGDLAKGTVVNIYRDLPRGEAKTLTRVTYTIPCELQFGGIPWLQYVEIHLPADEGISPGNDHYIQGKIDYDEPIREIK